MTCFHHDDQKDIVTDIQNSTVFSDPQ